MFRIVLLFAVLAGTASGESIDCAGFEALAQQVAAARDSDPAGAVERGQQALVEIESLQPSCPGGKAMLLGGIASSLTVLGRDSEAIVHYQHALETLGDDASADQIAFLNRGIGVAHLALGSRQEALGHYLVALAASEAAQNPIESAKTAGNIGILYMNIDDLEQSREFLAHSLEKFEEVGFKPGIAGALINLGSVAGRFGQRAHGAGDDETALREYRTLLELNRRAVALFGELDNQRGVAYAASNIGLAFNRMGEPAQALPHHRRALAIRRDVGDAFGTIDSLLSLADSMLDLQRHDEATALLDEAEVMIPGDAFNVRKDIEARRALVAEATGDYRTALAAQREMTRYAALSADADQLARIAALQDRFDADRAARQIDLLRGEAQLAELQLQRQRQVARLSVLVAVLVTGLLLVLFSRYRIGVTATRQLTLAARTDHLTGLSNRRHLVELMRYEMNRVERGGPPFSLLMIDIDDFKMINDTHGHGAGDAVLREVAGRLRAGVRKQDTIARWGGEEFLLLLPECGQDGALVLADKLRERIAAQPFLVAKSEAVTVTATIGVSEYQPGMAPDDCIRLADQALYRGKQSGKDQIGSADATFAPGGAADGDHALA